jgi:D-alanyl-D-alanine carboxypeptidase
VSPRAVPRFHRDRRHPSSPRRGRDRSCDDDDKEPYPCHDRGTKACSAGRDRERGREGNWHLAVQLHNRARSFPGIRGGLDDPQEDHPDPRGPLQNMDSLLQAGRIPGLRLLSRRQLAPLAQPRERHDPGDLGRASCTRPSTHPFSCARGAAIPRHYVRLANTVDAFMRRMLAAALTLAAISTLVVVGCAGSRSGDEAELGTLLDRVIAAGAPGVFVVVREDGKVRSEARGFADSSRSIPMRADERFRIGSITKTFVAALALLLVEDGTLGLDDTVERWLPGLVPAGRAITVRDLLSHRSGLFDYVEDDRVLRAHERRWTPRELISIAIAHPPEHSPAGGSFAYSSTNYLVLGLIMEEAGGGSLGSQLRERLFSPLGLRRTSFVPGAIRGLHVHGHRPPSHQGVVTGPPIDTSAEPAWWTWAAGAIVSSAGDLHRFFAALLRGRVLSTPLLREMETLVPAGRLQYGLGIATFPTPCVQAWGHTGNVQGTIAVAWNTKDASRQVVLVVNTYPLSAELEAAVRHLQDAAFCPAA